jgi:hypothetical protein
LRQGEHGVVEVHMQHLHAQVDGVAGQAAFGPAPVVVTNLIGVVRFAELGS